MVILALVLAGISLVVLIIGGVTILILSGQTNYRSGPEVGAEIMSGQVNQFPEERVGVQRSFFVGQGAAVERHATVDFAEVKAQLVAGNCLAMIPALLVISGFVGVFFFGALAVLFGVPNIWLGGAVMLLVLYFLLRMMIDFIRA
ncbi:MAG TPA: hypothetical protein G4N98_04715 [Thermoflexia bacterium]|nr:hypothetical protein [Thermoflexia bacterium]